MRKSGRWAAASAAGLVVVGMARRARRRQVGPPVLDALVGDKPSRNEPPAVDSADFAGAVGRGLAWLRSAAVPLSGAAAVTSAVFFARSLRYYDSVFVELGVAGLPVRADKAELSARAAVASTILVSFSVSLFFAFTSASSCARHRSHRWAPFTWFCITPVVVGGTIAFGPTRAGIGLALVAAGLLGFLACMAGLAVGREARRRESAQLRREGRPATDRRNRKPLPADVARPLSLGWLVLSVGLVIVMLWGFVDSDARADADAIRRGGSQGDVSALFAPVDIRRVRVAWKDPSTRPALPAGPMIMVGRADGRVIAVSTDRQLLDVPASEVVVRGS